MFILTLYKCNKNGSLEAMEYHSSSKTPGCIKLWTGNCKTKAELMQFLHPIFCIVQARFFNV